MIGLLNALPNQKQFIAPHRAIALFCLEPFKHLFPHPSMTSRLNVSRQKKKYNSPVASALVLSWFSHILTEQEKAWLKNYCPFPWRSEDCPYVIPQAASRPTALMGLDGRVRGIDCSVSLSKGAKEAFSPWEGTGEKNLFFLIFTQEYICEIVKSSLRHPCALLSNHVAVYSFCTLNPLCFQSAGAKSNMNLTSNLRLAVTRRV